MLASSLSATENRTLPAFSSHVFRRLERRKQKMLDVIDGWQPEWLTYSPGPDAWSMLQIFDHLILTERSVRISCVRNLALTHGPVSLNERWRAERFFVSFLLPTRVRIPKAVAFVTPAQPESLEPLIEEWAKERRLLFEFLVCQNKQSRHKVAMRHPAIGALSLDPALRFLVVHMWHHEYQIMRLRWAVSEAYI